MKRLTPYLTFGVLLLSLIGYLVDLPQKIKDLFDGEPDVVITELSGVVKYAGTEEPVVGATVIAKPNRDAPQELGEGKTDYKGTFTFSIKSPVGKMVWVVVTKDGWAGFHRFIAPKANMTILFRMKP